MKLNCIWWWGSYPRVWETLSIPSLQLFSGPLWPGVVVPVWILSIDQLEILLLLNNKNWNHLTVCNQMVDDRNYIAVFETI